MSLYRSADHPCDLCFVTIEYNGQEWCNAVHPRFSIDSIPDGERHDDCPLPVGYPLTGETQTLPCGCVSINGGEDYKFCQDCKGDMEVDSEALRNSAETSQAIEEDGE